MIKGIEKYQARLDELKARKEGLDLKLAPVRADYERLINDPRLIECRKLIKESNAVVGPIANEIAALTRLLGVKASMKIDAGVYDSSEIK